MTGARIGFRRLLIIFLKCQCLILVAFMSSAHFHNLCRYLLIAIKSISILAQTSVSKRLQRASGSASRQDRFCRGRLVSVGRALASRRNFGSVQYP